MDDRRGLGVQCLAQARVCFVLFLSLSLFSLSRLASTHPPMQSVLGLFSLGVKWPGHEVHLSVLLRLTMPGAIPPLPHMPS